MTSGVIVEVEAYIGEDDAACHAASGLTQRNLPLYGSAGYGYVYLNYGVHSLFNDVTESTGYPAPVLIRSVEPSAGEVLMRSRRHNLKSFGGGRLETTDLCRGPGNVARSFGITLHHNRIDMCSESLYIQDADHSRGAIAWSSRIGISAATAQLWRVYLRKSKSVSGSRRLNCPTVAGVP